MPRRTGLTRTVRKAKGTRARATAARKKARSLQRRIDRLLDAGLPRALAPVQKTLTHAAELTDSRERFERMSEKVLSTDTPSAVIERLEKAIEEAFVDALDTLGELAQELEQ